MIGTNAQMDSGTELRMRSVLVDADREAVRRIVRASNFFSDSEIEIAVELVEERLLKGPVSGYEFLVAERTTATASEARNAFMGYICFGEIPCTVGSYDIYWIVVAPEWQRTGIGSRLMHAAEREIQLRGGRRIYIDTSGKPQYAATRTFYARCGYRLACELPDFYDRGDSKVVFEKVLP